MKPINKACFTLAAVISTAAPHHLEAREFEILGRRENLPLNLSPTSPQQPGRGADDVVVPGATPDVRQGRGADDAVLPGATPDIRQGRGADDAVLNANGTPHIRQGRGADDVVVAGATPDIRQGRGADDVVLPGATPDIRQGRGADDVVVPGATPDVRQGRGADDVVLPGATPDIRQGRGADDAVLNADGTPHIRQGRGADDVVLPGATPDIRQGRGADDLLPAITTSALIPTASAILRPSSSGQSSPSSSSATTPRPVSNSKNPVKNITFGSSQKPQQTGALIPSATYRTSGKVRMLNVSVSGFVKIPEISTANLENGQIMGNLPEKARWRFAVYANQQQAQAAAALWAAPGSPANRSDRALHAADTGIIVWAEAAADSTDSASQSQGAIHGIAMRSDRNPELDSKFLKGKILQIYGPAILQKDSTGKVISSTREVYWTSHVIP